MRISEIMTTPVQTISPDDRGDHAWDVMQRGRFHHLVVVNGKRIVGVLSAHDLGDPQRSAYAVSELMTRDPLVLEGDATLREVANKLRGNAVGCLPVTRDGALVGIVTTSDILTAIGRGVTRPVERGERWTLKHRGPRHRPGPQGGVR